MKICLVGKYPPIQGGVSGRAYRYAHALAARGHQVHVITNAKEVKPPYRMVMREEDWAKCEADYGSGHVRVHWTDSANRSMFHIPMGSAFVSKLASLGATVGADVGFDVVFSYYMEPYGIAGHLIAEMLKVPHVLKTAGSDAGRLWSQPQLQPLYDHVFRSADYLVAGGKVAERMMAIGIERGRIWPDPDFTVQEDLFTPTGPELDVAGLCEAAANDPTFADLQWGRFRDDIPYIGLFGKLGDKKGTYPLLRALASLVESGRDVGLIVMGHEKPRGPQKFREMVRSLSLERHVVQIPFIPNWRVPEFIRRCLAVCCLEQDFPITFHAPIIPREVLCAGGCLVGSTEVIQKLPRSDRMIHGYNCIAVADVNDVEELSGKLAQVLDHPDKVPEIGRRGREYVIEAQSKLEFPVRLERILKRAIGKEFLEAVPRMGRRGPPADKFVLTSLVLRDFSSDGRAAIGDRGTPASLELDYAEQLLANVSRLTETGNSEFAVLRDVLTLEISLARMPSGGTHVADLGDTLFRLDGDCWKSYPENLQELVPRPAPNMRIEQFEFDARKLMEARAKGSLPKEIERRGCFVCFLSGPNDYDIRMLEIDERTVGILRHCDGESSVASIAASLSNAGDHDMRQALEQRLLELFELGMVRLRLPENAVSAGE
jgi:glycosyltransferase involved in cell wall biosynthesis